MWVSGITEGLLWRAVDSTGALQYPDWIEITRTLFPYRLIRAIGGTLFLTGFVLMVYNLYKTTQSKEEGFTPNNLREPEAM